MESSIPDLLGRVFARLVCLLPQPGADWNLKTLHKSASRRLEHADRLRTYFIV